MHANLFLYISVYGQKSKIRILTKLRYFNKRCIVQMQLEIHSRHLILGQAQFKLGNFHRAKDELVRAYIGGKKIFQRHDPKYYEYLKPFIKDIEL